MRKCTIDNRKVICPNASLLCGRTKILKAGLCFTYGDHDVARSLGRIKTVDTDGTDCAGYIVAMVLSHDATSCYERWIDPQDVTEIFDAPTALAAFFFAPTLPYKPETMRRLMAYGTTCERYVGKASHQHYVARFEAE